MDESWMAMVDGYRMDESWVMANGRMADVCMCVCIYVCIYVCMYDEGADDG